jgi:hypothetical protein
MRDSTRATDEERKMAKEAKTTRRVYKSELKRRTGWGDTWLRTKEKLGHIPAGRTDPGGKRKWWTDEEADQIVSGLPMASPSEGASSDRPSKSAYNVLGQRVG